MRDKIYKAKIMLMPAAAVRGQEDEISDQDWKLLLQAVAEEMKKRNPGLADGKR